MAKKVEFEVVRDCEIIHFMPKSFGEDIDNDVNLQRAELAEGCDNISEGYWVGAALYSVLCNMGLVVPTKNTKIQGVLTQRGNMFLNQEKSNRSKGESW